jgi:vacuolar-type H+-ATPase subunit F/Vma7
VAAVGELARIGGFALAGVRTAPAETPDEVRRAWGAAAGAAVVILTRAAADAVGESRFAASAPLSVVLPP